MQEIEVSARDSFKYTVNVPQAPTTLLWNFSTRNKNINFGLLRQIEEGKEYEAVLPIQKYESSKQTIKGERRIEVPGVYILVFDNTFSRNTSKKVTFFVALKEGSTESIQSDIPDLSGYLLKKKRKRLQGWAKRYFVYKNGQLAYFKHQGGLCRGTLSIQSSTISVDPINLIINIDSGTSLWHIKALSKEDFDQWTQKFKSSKIMESHTLPIDKAVEQFVEKIMMELAAIDNPRAKHLLENLNVLKIDLFEQLECEMNKSQSMQEAYQSILLENQQMREKLGLEPSKRKSVISNSSGALESWFDAEEIINVSEETKKEMFIEEIMDDSSEEEVLKKQNQRRQCLPSKMKAEGMQVFEFLRKNLATDLSTVSMPISMNEPINLLQKLAEDLEYVDLLHKASNLESLERLKMVTAFVVSTYSSTSTRTGRKPFNPMHGETYELIRPDLDFKFISEKVSHYPPVMASYCESKRWRYFQDSKIESKFWGKSIEFIPSGNCHIIFDNNDHFTFNKVTMCVRNIMSTQKNLAHYGQCIVLNEKTKEKAVLNFQDNEGGIFTRAPKTKNVVSGTLFNAEGERKGFFEGTWSDSLFFKDEDKLDVLWRSNPVPASSEYYGFTSFAIELNEITESENKMASSDTRLRPDQRMFEDGKLEEAELEKKRIEQLQRDKRKELELENKKIEPLWFKMENNQWIYKGGYFEQRESNTLPDVKLW